MTMRPLMEDTIARFHDRVEKDPALKKELEGVYKKVNINLCTESYHFYLENSRVEGFDTGLIDGADIIIESDCQTVTDLYSGKMKIMKAWALRKIRIKGSLEDVMRLRKFF
jgi:putative sterol carrier protein